MSQHYNYGYDTVHRSIWYYLVFPVDAWIKNEDPLYLEQKKSELWPILVGLLPLIVLLAGLTLELGLVSGIFFYVLEALLLSVVATFYLKLKDLAQSLNLFANFTLSCLGLTLIMLVFARFISLFV
jgi:hypothetical protein